MRKILYYLKNPFKDLADVNNLVMCSLLIALGVTVSFFNVYITKEIKLTFSFLFVAVIAMKYGPFIAGFSSGIIDILQYLIKPPGYAYDPRLLLSTIIVGILYGLFLYKDHSSIWRIISSHFLSKALISMLLNSYFLSTLFGQPYLLTFSIRLIPNAVLFPIELILLFFIIKLYIRIEREIK